MKKLFAMLLTLAMLTGLLAGCAGTPAATEPSTAAPAVSTEPASSEPKADGEEKLDLISNGVLTVGVEAAYPPFEYYAEDGTTIIGFDADVAAAVAQELGLELQFVDTAWDTIFQGCGTNYDVVISAACINEVRKQYVDFSDPYISNYQAIVVPADSDLTFSALTDLSGYSVSMQKETNSDIILQELVDTGSVANCVAVTNEKVTTCFEQLANGEVDVILCDSTVADGYVAKEPDEYKIAYVDADEVENFGIAMKKGDTVMAAAINQALQDLKDSGFLAECQTKWFG